MQKLGTDIVSGAVFIALGLFFLVYSIAALPIGTPNRMGPGYFPLSLAIVLVLLGAGIIYFREPDRLADMAEAVPWRSVGLIVLALAIFGVTIRGVGLVPAVAVLVFVAAFASRRTTLPQASVATLGITLFCVAVFHYGLNLNVRLIGPWLQPG